LYDSIIQQNKQQKNKGLNKGMLRNYPTIIEILLLDQTTKQNIFWATNNYQSLGKYYSFSSPILSELLLMKNKRVILPRIKKNKTLKQIRLREMAEVFTPSWICNAQNNLIDSAWFGRKKTFNTEITRKDGSHTWKTNKEKIRFSKDKTWEKYVEDTRLEVSCGEAPYITSRYDTTTGEFIPIVDRVGLLDRKIRVINENCENPKEWLKFIQTAYENIYAFEWQGDSLFLAREAMLLAFVDNYVYKFSKNPSIKKIETIANIISWNVWQMDGIKGVIPNSCCEKNSEQLQFFGEEKKLPCPGCASDNLFEHTGIYCLINDWSLNDEQTGKKGKKIKFINLLNR